MSERRQVIAIAVKGELDPIGDIHWFNVGDQKGVALFGFDQRREDDTERALLWALTHNDEKRHMVVCELTVDAHSTPAIDWDKSFESEFRFTQPGDVLVSTGVAKLYQRLFLFETLRENQRQLFFLRGTRKRPQRIRGIRPEYSPLIGREKELNHLLSLWEQASVDQGQIAALIGDAGIGKTRLMEAFKEKFNDKQIEVRSGHYSPTSSRPYEAFESILSTLSRIHNDLTEAEQDFIQMILEPSKPRERFKDLTEKQIQQGLFYSIRKLLHRHGQKPLVLIIEDLHWADPLSLDLINEIADGFEATKIFLLLTFRSDFTEARSRWGKLLHFNELSLKPLPAQHLNDFVTNLLAIDHIAEPVRNYVFKSSSGNPLYVEELLRQSLDSKTVAIETDDSGYRTLRMKSKPKKSVPAAIQNLLSSGFDRLETEQKEVLLWASVFGSTFSTDHLEGIVSENSSIPVQRVLTELSLKNYLREKSSFPLRLHQFNHDLLFEVVKNSLSTTDKKNRHTLLAQYLKKRYDIPTPTHLEEIAIHFLQGNNEEECLRASLQAGKALLAAQQYSKASNFFREAFLRWERLTPSDLPLQEIYRPWVQALLASNQLDRVRNILSKWEKMVAAPSMEHAHLQRLKMSYHLARSNCAAALEASEMAKSLFPATASFSQEKFEFVLERAEALFSIGKSHEALHEVRLALRDLKKNIPDFELRLNLTAIQLATLSGNPNLALDASLTELYLDQITQFPMEHQTEKFRVDILFGRGAILEALLRFEEAEDLFLHGIRIAEDGGLRQLLARGWAMKGHAAAAQGKYAKALESFEISLSESNKIKDRNTQILAMEGISEVLLHLGVPDEAQALRIEPDSPFFKNASVDTLIRRLGVEALLQWELGNLNETVTLLKRASRIADEAQNFIERDRCTLQLIRAKKEFRNQFVDIPYRKERSLAAESLATQLSFNPSTLIDHDLLQNAPAWLRREILFRSKDKDAYQKEVEHQLTSVPNRYRDSFLRHPLFG